MLSKRNPKLYEQLTLEWVQRSNVVACKVFKNKIDELIEMADLVTEMKEVKHYYAKGITARVGIEY